MMPDIDEIYKDRVKLAATALVDGISIKYKDNYFLYYNGNTLYKTNPKKLFDNRVGPGTCDLQEFLNYFESAPPDEIKVIYGNIKLYNLQQKLIKESLSSEAKPK